MSDPTKRIRPTNPGRLAAPRQAQQLPPLPVTRARIGERMATEVFQEMGEGMLEELQNFRRDLHRNPEIGLDLPRTQKKVLEALEGLPLEIHVGQDLSSVVAVLRGGQRADRQPVCLDEWVYARRRARPAYRRTGGRGADSV